MTTECMEIARKMPVTFDRFDDAAAYIKRMMPDETMTVRDNVAQAITSGGSTLVRLGEHPENCNQTARLVSPSNAKWSIFQKQVGGKTRFQASPAWMLNDMQSFGFRDLFSSYQDAYDALEIINGMEG